MRFLVWILGSCVLWGGTVPLLPAIADESATSIDAASEPRPLQTDGVQTLLRFETQHYLVRVFQQQGLLYLNVYNKETGITDRNRVLADVVPPRSDDDHGWRTYVNQEGDLHYLARVNPQGLTELEIRVAGGSPAQPEVGFNATYGFPHMYLGETLDQALTDLEASGWAVDDETVHRVELTQDERSLTLKFDPDTQVITHTQLDDVL